MRVSDDVLREIVAREYGGYAHPDEVEAMARELRLARAVIAALLVERVSYDTCPCDTCRSLRAYEEGTK